MRVLLYSAVLVVVAAVSADAQVCIGQAPSSSAPYRVLGSAEFGDDAKGYTGGLMANGAAAFGGVSVGYITYDDTDESTTALGLTAGYEVPVGAARSVSICPLASATYGFGPNDVDIEGVSVDMSSYSFQFGLSLGTAIQSSPQFQMIPSAGLAFAYTNVKLEALGDEENLDDTFGLATLGVGFVFNQMLTLRPGVAIPFGLDESDPTFGLAVSVGFGRRP